MSMREEGQTKAGADGRKTSTDIQKNQFHSLVNRTVDSGVDC